MAVILSGPSFQNVQFLVEGVSKREHVNAQTLNQRMVGTTARNWDQQVRQKNATLLHAQNLRLWRIKGRSISLLRAVKGIFMNGGYIASFISCKIAMFCLIYNTIFFYFARAEVRRNYNKIPQIYVRARNNKYF